jgi:tetratricopeptide (TPR) repeat protein
MIKISEIPYIAQEFSKIIDAYFDFDANPRRTIPLVKEFLAKYPYYPEAYNFLAVLFIADAQFPKAMKCLKAVERIDPWRLHGVFDKAEILILRKKLDEGINALIEGVRLYAHELTLGLDNFISSLEPANKTKFEKLILNSICEYLKSNGDNEAVFEELKNSISNWNFNYLK